MWPRPGAADEFLKFICLFLSTILSPLTKKSEGRRLQSIQQVCEHSPPPFNRRRRRRKRPRKSKSLVFFMAIPPSPFPNVFPSEEKERYITRNLFIWEVLHVYHKRRRALAAPWETCVLSWPRRVGGCTSRDTSRRLSVYNLTPTCVTWRFASSPECALIQTTTTKPKKPPSRSPLHPTAFRFRLIAGDWWYFWRPRWMERWR